MRVRVEGFRAFRILGFRVQGVGAYGFGVQGSGLLCFKCGGGRETGYLRLKF